MSQGINSGRMPYSLYSSGRNHHTQQKSLKPLSALLPRSIVSEPDLRIRQDRNLIEPKAQVNAQFSIGFIGSGVAAGHFKPVSFAQAPSGRNAKGQDFPSRVAPVLPKLATQKLSPQDAPYLQSVIKNAKPGDVIELQAGMYHIGDLDINGKNDLTIIAAPGAKILGNLKIKQSQNISLQNLDITGSKINRSNTVKRTEVNEPEISIKSSSGILMDGLRVNHLNGNGARGKDTRSMLEIDKQSQNIQVQKSVFYSGNPNMILSPGVKHLLVNGVSSRGKNVSVVENRFENIGIAIQSGGDSAWIQGNHISKFSQDGIQVFGHNTKIIANTISDLYYLDSVLDSDKVAHHDGIQAWAPDPKGERDGRFKGRSALENITILANQIDSTTDLNRPYQGVLQGIVAFDGYMDGWKIQDNHIKTHSTVHGIAINGPRNSKTSRFTISGNTIEHQWAQKPINHMKPTINLNVLRFKHHPRNPHESWSWRNQSDEYDVQMKDNHLTSPATIKPGIRVQR